MKKTFLFPLIALCAAFFAMLAGCSNINTHHGTTSVSFTLDGAKFISALPSSRSALLARGGTDTEDGDEDWLEKEDLRRKLFVRVALFGDGYADTKTEEWMIAEEDTDVEFKTMTFDEVPVGKSVKARVVAYITLEATGQGGEKISYTYPVALGESNNAKVVDGTTTLEMPVTFFKYDEDEEPLMGSVSGNNDCTYMLMRYATGETTGVYMIMRMYNSDDEYYFTSDIISVGAYTFNESTHSVAVSEYACLADKGTQFNILTRTNTQTLDLTRTSLSVTSAHGETIVFENGEPDDDALFTAHGTVSYTYLGQTVSAACVFSANSDFTYTIESEAITYTLGDTSITIFPAGTISGGTYALSEDITEEPATLTLVEGWYYDPLKSEKVTIDTSEEKIFDILSGTFTYTSASGLSIKFTIDGLEPKTEYSIISDILSGEYDGTLTFELYSDLTYNITYLASEADDSSDGIIISKGYYGASANLSIRAAISDKVDVYETAYLASLSDTELTEVEEPTAQTIDLTSSTFTFTSGSGLAMSFATNPEPLGPIPFTLTINTSCKETLSSVDVYSIDQDNYLTWAEALADTDKTNEQIAAVLIPMLEKNELYPEQVTYLGNYKESYGTLSVADDGTITITDSFTSWGSMGIGNTVAFIALVNYGDGADVTQFYVATSTITVVDSSKNSVTLNAYSYAVPCEISFELGSVTPSDYIIRTAVNSFAPHSASETFISTIKHVASSVVSSLEEKGYTYSTYEYGYTNGIPWVTLEYEASTTANVGSFDIDLAELNATDKGATIDLKAVEDADSGSITLTATPATGTTVSAYAWIIDGSSVDGATEATYILTEDVLSGLTSGNHDVTCVVTIDDEPYSVRTTFTVE